MVIDYEADCSLSQFLLHCCCHQPSTGGCRTTILCSDQHQYEYSQATCVPFVSAYVMVAVTGALHDRSIAMETASSHHSAMVEPSAQMHTLDPSISSCPNATVMRSRTHFEALHWPLICISSSHSRPQLVEPVKEQRTEFNSWRRNLTGAGEAEERATRATRASSVPSMVRDHILISLQLWVVVYIS